MNNQFNHFRFWMGDFQNQGGYNPKGRYALKDYKHKQADVKPIIPTRQGGWRGNYYDNRFYLYHH